MSLGKKLQHIKSPLISIVDDDRSVVEATVSLIQSVGFRAKGFLSAEQFLSSRQTACLILDVRMPGIGRLELGRRLAAGGHRIPIIFMTAHGGDDVSTQAFQAGAVEFLIKPFSQESLVRAVRSALAEPRGGN
jgi:FixJ family two-component response regulator